ncbi:MAG: hypothetical protein IH948_06450 [Bacteroidetes bacterium]|nr:hypothetical protein [Bacteroidota bacterium]
MKPKRLIAIVLLVVLFIIGILVLVELFFIEEGNIVQSKISGKYNTVGIGAENPLREIKLYYDIRTEDNSNDTIMNKELNVNVQ